jgi:two-component system, sensor histidine kinase and response regulator
MAATALTATPSRSVSVTTSKSAEKPTLLVVDDEEGPRASLKIVFKNDFDVQLASSGAEALGIARQRRIDVAILDILMHGMSGVEVLRELKQIDSDIEVIMLTAYETLETARQALRFGAHEYLNKPFDIPGLRSVVAKALEKRRASHELRNAHQRLRLLQEELTDAAARGTTATHVVHDLNNPLTVISGFVELLNRQVQSVATLQGDELERMKSSIARIHLQVQRCLEISRRYLGGQRKATPGEERTLVNDVLADLEELLFKHPSAANNSLVVQHLSSPVFAAMNGTDLLRVLLNLATNALQACEGAHRIEVSAERLSGLAEVSRMVNSDTERFVAADSLATSQPLVAISVRDNGGGIPPEIVRRLFNEQFTTKPVGRGHGIGLGSVKDLVMTAGGAVRLSTVVGEGSVFTVILPARD